jgi:hypothetical protein
MALDCRRILTHYVKLNNAFGSLKRFKLRPKVHQLCHVGIRLSGRENPVAFGGCWQGEDAVGLGRLGYVFVVSVLKKLLHRVCFTT